MIDFDALDNEEFTGKKTEEVDGVTTSFFFWKGKLARKNNMPAVIASDGTRTEYHAWLSYKEHGKHREDGPAIVLKDKEGNITYQAWYVEGELHSLRGPAESGKDIPDKYAIEGREMTKEKWEVEAPAHMFKF
jgi:uncharacterized protein involved in tolerance to divalent cations